MRLSELVTHMSPSQLTEIAMVIFLASYLRDTRQLDGKRLRA